MAIKGSPYTTANYKNWQNVSEPDLAYAPPNMGGTVSKLIGVIDFQDTTAKTLFTLPKGAVIDYVKIDVTVAFDAGTTNVIDVGSGADADALVNDAAGGTIARLFPTQNVTTTLYTPLTTETDVTATYAQTGDAATEGTAYITVYYSLLRSG